MDKQATIPNVREYGEQMPVWLGRENNGRLSIGAANEGGYNATGIDAYEFVDFLAAICPEVPADKLKAAIVTWFESQPDTSQSPKPYRQNYNAADDVFEKSKSKPSDIYGKAKLIEM